LIVIPLGRSFFIEVQKAFFFSRSEFELLTDAMRFAGMNINSPLQNVILMRPGAA